MEYWKREREIRLAGLFNGLEPIDVGDVRKELASLEATIPQRFDKMVANLTRLRGESIREYARRTDANLDDMTAAA